MNINFFLISISFIISSTIDAMEAARSINAPQKKMFHNTSKIMPFDAAEYHEIPVATLIHPQNPGSIIPLDIIPEPYLTENFDNRLSLYDHELAIIKNQDNNIHKKNSLIRALTGTISYQQDQQTIIYNKMTGTITYKNKKGKTVKELIKNSHGITTETLYTNNKISELDKQVEQKITSQTLYLNNNRFGKRTSTTTIHQTTFITSLDITIPSTIIIVENYDEQNRLTSSMDKDQVITFYPINRGDTMIIYYPDNSKTTMFDNDIDATIQTVKASGMYHTAFHQFLSEQVTSE